MTSLAASPLPWRAAASTEGACGSGFGSRDQSFTSRNVWGALPPPHAAGLCASGWW